jgi:hypothetical protein
MTKTAFGNLPSAFTDEQQSQTSCDYATSAEELEACLASANINLTGAEQSVINDQTLTDEELPLFTRVIKSANTPIGKLIFSQKGQVTETAAISGAKKLYENPLAKQVLQKTKQKISRGFEAFLILADNNQLQSGMNWFSEVANTTEDDTGRNELMQECMIDEDTEASAIWNEINKSMAEYGRFKDNFTIDKFVGLEEIQLLLDDSARGQEDQQEGFEDARHRYVINRLLANIFVTNDTEDAREQIASWSDVLAQYV